MPAKPDLSEFIRYSKPRRPACTIEVAKETLGLSDDERRQLDAALAADAGIITPGAISQWLEKRGHKASAAAIASHRRHQCRCFDA